ncbi:hypothetical protein [Nocardia acidivorans]|uniref:hypothetical protein n=1 Tax=Nocardia acidivorans TaxID=404580 RepID=UPI000830BBCC|nr:hypothetical protein [Nocardia acidivorans]
MTSVIKVFTPIKRVPTVIGKAQNGQKLPFGPYTLPQIAAAAGLLAITAVCSMSFPINPAGTFVAGLVVTVVSVFALGLIPYTGVRLTSRVLWVGRLLVHRKPVSASGMPIDAESARHTLFIEESVVVIFPESPSAQPRATAHVPNLGAGGSLLAAIDDGRALLPGGRG